jgi:hypothetical protein
MRDGRQRRATGVVVEICGRITTFAGVGCIHTGESCERRDEGKRLGLADWVAAVPDLMMREETRPLNGKPEMVEDLRAETVRTRVMVGHALCAIAGSAAQGGMVDRALQNLVTARHILEEVRVYASDGDGMPEEAVRELLGFVRELRQRAQEMEQALRVLTPGEDPGRQKKARRRVGRGAAFGDHGEVPQKR